MSEAGKATATLPQAPAVPQDPPPKSQVGGGVSQAEALAPCALVPRNPCVPLAPASSAPAVSEDPEKKVLATKVLGTVKWFNIRKGYGFVSGNDTREDVFVHQAAIIKHNAGNACAGWEREKPWSSRRLKGRGVLRQPP